MQCNGAVRQDVWIPVRKRLDVSFYDRYCLTMDANLPRGWCFPIVSPGQSFSYLQFPADFDGTHNVKRIRSHKPRPNLKCTTCKWANPSWSQYRGVVRLETLGNGARSSAKRGSSDVWLAQNPVAWLAWAWESVAIYVIWRNDHPQLLVWCPDASLHGKRTTWSSIQGKRTFLPSVVKIWRRLSSVKYLVYSRLYSGSFGPGPVTAHHAAKGTRQLFALHPAKHSPQLASWPRLQQGRRPSRATKKTMGKGVEHEQVSTGWMAKISTSTLQKLPYYETFFSKHSPLYALSPSVARATAAMSAWRRAKVRARPGAAKMVHAHSWASKSLG